jgi:hypothetical protein
MPCGNLRTAMNDTSRAMLPKDPAYVDADDAQDLRYWAQAFGVSQQQVRDAVAAVGPEADAVQQKLRA